uniref:SFRICE_037408 n=1 Tax=Spodoptera frugiperda TaxID=7108 RepID=A0A2H1WK80_SPOFR
MSLSHVSMRRVSVTIPVLSTVRSAPRCSAPPRCPPHSTAPLSSAPHRLALCSAPLMLFPLKRCGDFEHIDWSIRAPLSSSPPRSASMETRPNGASEVRLCELSRRYRLHSR